MIPRLNFEGKSHALPPKPLSRDPVFDNKPFKYLARDAQRAILTLRSVFGTAQVNHSGYRAEFPQHGVRAHLEDFCYFPWRNPIRALHNGRRHAKTGLLASTEKLETLFHQKEGW